ncbi:hypothetical protein [Pseudovibrio ascidiaceicola]|uniref:hypothetical protein n=1 Tax=Pseudovibrio ascidiaceicola TaxID=285279 RepID=UPI001AD911F0|nr:hypothetical protein [Pseudovibrio ascidiaceicola]
MQAGNIAQQAGSINEAGCSPIVPATLQGQLDENIHVLGDATQNRAMPKSGYSLKIRPKLPPWRSVTPSPAHARSNHGSPTPAGRCSLQTTA